MNTGAPLALRFDDVERTYAHRGSRRTALAGVSLSIRPGEFAALLGPNGSGKSTLMRLAATLDSPTRGTVSVLGHDPASSGRKNARAGLGVVFQAPALDSLLTVRENLELQGALAGLDAKEAAERAFTVAQLMGIADRFRERAGRLSGGLLRRADLARALVTRPSLLLLDEPTTGLDHDARASFLGLLDQMRRAHPQLAIVMTTHLMDEAERADRVLMLCEGRVVADDTPKALREGMGDRVMRVSHEHATHLDGAGLDVRSDSEGAIATGSSADVERACAALIERGVHVSVGPPTLGEVYSALAGSSQNGDRP